MKTAAGTDRLNFWQWAWYWQYLLHSLVRPSDSACWGLGLPQAKSEQMIAGRWWRWVPANFSRAMGVLLPACYMCGLLGLLTKLEASHD